MSIILKQNETMKDIVEKLGFASEWVYEIAPIAYWYENLYPNGRIRDIHFSRRMREMLGYHSIEEFPDELNTLMTFTHPDDVHLMLDDAIRAGTGQIDKYDVQYRIRKADGSYLWCNATGELIKDASGVTVGMYGAFIDISAEIALRQEQEDEQHSRELISSFAKRYEAVILASLKDGSYTVLSGKDSLGGCFPETDTIEAACARFFGAFAHPLDRERIEKEHVSFKDIPVRYAVGESHAIEFRKKKDTGYYWYRFAFDRTGKDEILIGLADCDLAHTVRLIDEKLMGEYDAIYVVSLDRCSIRPIRSSRVSAAGAFDGDREYTAAILSFAETVAPQYKEDWVRFSDTAYMKRYMAKDDRREYVYELPSAKKAMRRFTIDVIERVNGEASSLLFSFTGIDDARANAIRLHRQLAEQSARIEDANRRIELVHGIVKASLWTYDIGADGSVLAAHYDDHVNRRASVNTADPMGWLKAIHPEDRERAASEFLAAARDLTGNTPYEITYRMLLSNGDIAWVKTSGKLIPHGDGTAELTGISINITDQMIAQQKQLLGAVPLSPAVLTKANIGLWAFELDEGQPPRMYGDETMLALVGLDHQVPPEEMYHAWYDRIDKASYGLVNDAVEKMISGEHAEVQYPWHHPDGYTMIVRCGGIRNESYAKGIRVEGTHQDVTETLRFDEEENERLRETETRYRHEQLRSEVLNYMIDHDDDPIELLKNFAERLRALIECDQVIYRDLEETRIMVNSDGIANTWSVPIEYCMQCQHFDAHHPMYKDGYTEMDNCQEGWQGIPVYDKCPIKSSLTRIVYCDGETAGYLAIHYVQKYHCFTDIERRTLEEFARILSMSLSRYAARERAKELDSVRHRMNMIYSLSDEYDPIFVLDPVTGVYDWYEAKAAEIEELTNMSMHGTDFYKDIGVDTAMIIHEEDREQFRSVYNRENMLRIAATGETQETENRWQVGPDGTYLWKYNKIVRMVDEDGKVYVVVGVVDTTAAKEKEAAFTAQSRRLEEQRAFTSYFLQPYMSAYYIGLDDLSCRIYKRTTQLENDYPIVSSYLDSLTEYIDKEVHPEDKEEFKRLILPETIKGILAERAEFRYMFRVVSSGETRYIRFQVIRGADENHAAFGFRDITDDIRDQEAQQRRLEEALTMAQSASRAKTTFLNNMSHDIRTPMNAIIGYTGLAASHIDNRELVQDYLSKIGQSSDHLLSLINDVLDMSRIESGKMNLEEKPENLSDIIHTLRDIVQADIRSKQLDFFVDAVDVNDEDVICDKLRLNQVLLNILSNAIKYTAAGGTVTLRVTERTIKPNGYASFDFCVKDNGMGMDETFLKTIFDPFTRVKSSTVSGIQGTGLGMAITKNIIDMMGGTIDIESEPGRGTEVTVRLDFRLLSAPKEPLEIPEFKGVRALIADDDTNTCLSICDMVKDIGMRYEWCTSGKEAIIRAEAAYRDGDLFRVYIIDWIMPDMNGIETTRRIRKVIGDDTPIIILTAYDWSDIEEEARDAGVTAFVSKPMFPSDLRRVLNSCLGREEMPETKPAAFDFSGKKILLVEDNEMNREIATEILEENGFVIDTAEDGDIAVDKMKSAAEGDYDLILMDIQMPTMDGYEATRQIRALGTAISRIPIIAMTANAFEEDRKLAIEAGMNEHIAKPIDVDRLKETLARFL